MSNYTDRSFQNNLNDYTDQNYLDDGHNKLKKEYSDYIWNYLNLAIHRLDRAVEKPKIDYTDYSVYTGISGIALTYLKLYECTNDVKYLVRADALIQNALSNLPRDRISFLCGDAGPLSIAAYIAHLKKDTEGCKSFVERLLKRSERVLSPDSSICDELLYGRVGYAYSLLFVQNKISKELIPEATLVKLFNTIIESGSKTAKHMNGPPLMYEWHEKKYLGAGHGLSGILYILMKIADQFKDLQANVEYLIVPTINFLITCKYPSGNYKSSLESNSDKLVQFCHGSVGVEFLFNFAFKMIKNRQYLEEVLRCGEVVWTRGLLRKGYGICHGTAGNAYTLLDVYNLTNDPKWLHRAWMFAKWCCTPNEHEINHEPDRPYSLFEGLAGTIYFLIDMLDPKNAKFPAFQF